MSQLPGKQMSASDGDFIFTRLRYSTATSNFAAQMMRTTCVIGTTKKRHFKITAFFS